MKRPSIRQVFAFLLFWMPMTILFSPVLLIQLFGYGLGILVHGKEEWTKELKRIEELKKTGWMPL